ncbi:MAG TPA: hypothetical protein VM843_03330, partial [Flavisolibacter sp.]|nr:hypothetical protein [Flavisolibacter sp.]
MKYVFALFTFLFLHTLTQAQTFSEATLPITASGTKQSAQALVYLPLNYDAGKKYPLVVYAHGVSEAGTDIATLYNTGLPKVLKSGYRPPFDFIMVAVQSPSYSISPLWLPSILEWSQTKWALDTNRIYLTGISAGGWASFGSQLNVSPQTAAKFSAIAVHSGATQSLLTKNLSWWGQSKTPVWSVVGAADPNYVTQNEQLINSINALVPGLGHLTIRPAIGHGGWDDLYRGQVLNNGKNVWEWFEQFSRSNK